MDSEKDQAQTGVTSTAGNSSGSRRSAKPRTAPDAGQTLEILATAINAARDAGIEVRLGESTRDGHTSTVVVLVDVRLEDGRLVRVTREEK